MCRKYDWSFGIPLQSNGPRRKTGAFYVLVNARMPSILAEISFISNPEEERLLSDGVTDGRLLRQSFRNKKYIQATPLLAQPKEGTILINNIKLLIEYDGTNYHGWQRQASPHGEEGDAHQTIQGTIEDVLTSIIKQPAKVVAAGRTDAGVHAMGQVVHFKTTLRINESSWVKAINSLLPADIVVKKAEYVPEEFHARFDAKSKVYRYVIVNSGCPSPFLRNYVWHIKRPLDIALMREAPQYLIGNHDFSSFRASDCSAKSPVRTLDRLEVDEVSAREFQALGTLPFGSVLPAHYLFTLKPGLPPAYGQEHCWDACRVGRGK